MQFLEQKYGYYHCKDCNLRWESAYVWCVQGTNKVIYGIWRLNHVVAYLLKCWEFPHAVLAHLTITDSIFTVSFKGVFQAVLQNMSEIIQPIPGWGHNLSGKPIEVLTFKDDVKRENKSQDIKHLNWRNFNMPTVLYWRTLVSKCKVGVSVVHKQLPFNSSRTDPFTHCPFCINCN